MLGIGSCPDSVFINCDRGEVLDFLSFTSFTCKTDTVHQIRTHVQVKEHNAINLTTQCLLYGRHPQNVSCSYFIILYQGTQTSIGDRQ